MNRRDFVKSIGLGVLPVAGVAAGVSLDSQQTPQTVKAPFKVQAEDGTELIIDAKDGIFTVTRSDMPEEDAVFAIHEPKEMEFFADQFNNAQGQPVITIQQPTISKMTVMDITPHRKKG